MKINRFLDACDCSVEVDAYVPFTIRFDIPSDGVPLYWRPMDGKKNLAEFAIDRTDGCLRSVALICIDFDHVKRIDGRLTDSPLKESIGIPAFDFDNWSGGDFRNSFIDQKSGGFKMLLGEGFVTLDLGFEKDVDRVLRCGRGRFGIGAGGEILSVDLLGLSESEQKIIESIGTSSKS